MTKPTAMDSALTQHYARKERITAVADEFRKKIKWDEPERKERGRIALRLQEDPYWLGNSTANADAKLVYKILEKEKQ